MAKNKKNAKHIEAMKRKTSAMTEMAEIGLKIEDDRALIGFIFNHLSISHLTYLGINSINQLCKKYAGIDVCLFTQHTSLPCVPQLCPIFSVSDLARWYYYPLVATSIETTIEALYSNAHTVYHYAFDPHFINEPNKESSDLKTAFCDPRVRVIVRHKDHQELIEAEFSIEICAIIPDFDAKKIVKLALTEMQKK